MIDPDDPFGAGPLAGFALEGVTNGATITGIEFGKHDTKAILLRCTKRPEGEVFVTYAHGSAPARALSGEPGRLARGLR
jgi:hypothetical protein